MKSSNLEDAYGVGSSAKDRHVVRIQLGDLTAGAEAPDCCAVCREPLEWISVGQCGHRVVCSRCMMRIRYVDGDKRCCVCRAHCPTVLVTRADGAHGGTAAVFREYWYHYKTAAYFDDEQQYQAAREACRKKWSPFYHPLYVFITLLVSSITIGGVIGNAFAEEMKHKALKVLAYALSIFVTLSIPGFIWFMFKCNRDPLEDDDEEEFQAARVAKPTRAALACCSLGDNITENQDCYMTI